jgi:hypothetical protein
MDSGSGEHGKMEEKQQEMETDGYTEEELLKKADSLLATPPAPKETASIKKTAPQTPLRNPSVSSLIVDLTRFKPKLK